MCVYVKAEPMDSLTLSLRKCVCVCVCVHNRAKHIFMCVHVKARANRLTNTPIAEVCMYVCLCIHKSQWTHLCVCTLHTHTHTHAPIPTHWKGVHFRQCRNVIHEHVTEFLVLWYCCPGDWRYSLQHDQTEWGAIRRRRPSTWAHPKDPQDQSPVKPVWRHQTTHWHKETGEESGEVIQPV